VSSPLSIWPLPQHVIPERLLSRLLADIWDGYSDAHVAITQIPLCDTHPLSRAVRPLRVRCAATLLARMQDEGLRVFDPVIVKTLGARPWRLILPPILETRGSSHFVVDGVHRLYAARSGGRLHVRAVAMVGVLTPFPSQPRTWEELTVVKARLSPRDMMGTYEERFFRPVAARLSRLHFSSRRELDDFVRHWSD
jgi:hypothetical protein